MIDFPLKQSIALLVVAILIMLTVGSCIRDLINKENKIKEDSFMGKRVTKEMMLIDVVEEQKTSETGLILDAGNGETTEGKIVAIGALVKEVKVGDTVVWMTRATKHWTTDGDKNLAVVHADNVLSIND